MELHKYGGKTDNLALAQLSLLKWNIQLGHINFRSIIIFARLGLICSILTTIREEDIPRCSACCFGKQFFTYPKTDVSEAVIAKIHDKPGILISNKSN